ncbi:ubiquinone/menaquinone biosynthesis C-methylase UbiE [Phyllobacterium ifriqiyense]|uniref:Ubiquinone/menaquinone biosynthesis C-methylase UbiE n=1 Tax=Phyllobacterium ifriqiyense TaxID=314238 RepID=A0ABU0SFM0_9HYPH|nr:class I SAM-dependent methyltransferase [Phyllobacterium ifriqiyense]MDQ0999276.1 ubiquinone/menaquinone biosynthesis C-methylase UbiE [Phyllobacterium ifriqiyense]
MPKSNNLSDAEQTVEEIIELPFDGERYIPGMGGRIAAEHLARYAFATQFIRGKAVLDIASGEGYGTAIMAEKAKNIIGMDVAANAIAYAKRKYAKIRNVQFEVGDLAHLPFDTDTFDVIVCFETVEHVDDPLAAINELQRVLKSNGLLIISTPNKENYSDRFNYDNPYHLKELAFSEFQNALNNTFKHTKLFGQFSGASSHVVEIDSHGEWKMPNNDFKMTYADVPKWTERFDGVTATPMYFLAVCSNTTIDSNVENYGFFDASDWQVIDEEFLLRKTQNDLDTCANDLKERDTRLETTTQDLHSHKVEVNSLRSSLQLAQEEHEKLANALETTRLENETRLARINRLSDALDSLREQLHNVHSSTTWRLAIRFNSLINRIPFLKGAAKFLARLIVPRQ